MFNVRNNTLHGIKWTSINALASRVVSFGLGIILARLLSPADFGIIGMTAILFSLAGILINGGLTVALLRKKSITDADTSTIFFFNITVSSICALIICVFSSSIASFFNTPILTGIVKILALSMVIGSFGSVQWTLCSKAINFKTPALIHLPVQIITGLIGVILAYRGYGPWALVIQGFLSTLFSTVAIWYLSKWRPKLIFSIKSFKELFGFGGNLAVNSILDKFYNDGVGMVIGKFYSPDQLGYYSKGQGTAQLPSTFIFNVVGGVLLPVLSNVQDEKERLMRVYRRLMRMLSIVIFFAIFLMIALARPITIFLYSEKWEPAIIYMQIFGLRYMMYHVHALNWNLLLVNGRSDWALKKEIINKAVNFALLFSAIPFGPIYIAAACAAASVLCIVVNTWVAGRLFDFGFRKQCSDFLPYAIMSVIACAPAFGIARLNIAPILAILVGGVLSPVLYFGYLFWRKDKDFMELLQITPLRKYSWLRTIGGL